MCASIDYATKNRSKTSKQTYSNHGSIFMHRIQASPVGFHPELDENKGFYYYFFSNTNCSQPTEKKFKKKSR